MESAVIESPYGSIEFALSGRGFPVLVSHGAAGGFDQGLLVSEPLVKEGFQIIAPSRDGYLRSPLTKNSSPQNQSEKYKWLLDKLGCKRYAIVALSSGSPSAIECVLGDQANCIALILISSIVRSIQPAYIGSLPESSVLSFLTSPIYRYFRAHLPDSLLLRGLGITKQIEQENNSNFETANTLRQILLAVRDPNDVRTNGAIADIACILRLPSYPFEKISTRVLAIHGTKDTFAPIIAVKQAIASIPNGKIEEIQGAGHLCSITHKAHVFSRVIPFLHSVFE